MKKWTAFVLALLLVLFAAVGCQNGGQKPTDSSKPEESKSVQTDPSVETTPPEPEKEPVELVVFAAASMTETLTELANQYMSENKNVTIVMTFDSSGTLKKQIEEGAICDIFLSAAQKQMDALDSAAPAEKNPDGLDFVLQGTRFDILENKVALAVPEGNPKEVKSYDDLKEKLLTGDILLCMGNADVPVGQYTSKILKYFELEEDALARDGKITYASNVKEVTSQVKEGAVDCGIIYQTDAKSAELTVVDTATAEMCGQVIYPVAVMKESTKPEEAGAFLEFLKSDAADAVFEAVGFTPVG
ncbi:MAG: molybdate ABC transporter substrate-binding protein [Clostridiaceae bacterium]|jgi:molybdate transport system substrate-binding protein|nr:molybdate ABC transporter substrate-binding protein [Clostridiaceae bacterium]